MRIKKRNGEYHAKDHRKRDMAAAKVAQKLNKGKVPVRIDRRTVIYCHPDMVGKIKAQYQV